MRNKLIISYLAVLFTLLASFPSFSQSYDASKINNNTAQQALENVIVTRFEDPSYWYASIPQDQGFISIRRLPGIPKGKAEEDKERLDKEKGIGIPPGGYVLGAKVEFYKRGMNYFYIYPTQPIAMEGLVKTFSIWVVGRNFNHVLKALVLDYVGSIKEIHLGKMNFSGWRKLTVAIPPQIRQTDYHYTYKNGLKFVGLKVECDLKEAYGTYYIYFDDASVVTDLFQETYRDEDDLADQW